MANLDDLLNRRVVWIVGEIEQATTHQIIAKLLFLQSQDGNLPIHVVIDSNGGSVAEGFAILDTFDFVSCPVFTFCPKYAHSLATVILAHGEPTHRYVGPSAQLALTRPFDDSQSSASEIENTESQLIDELSRTTKKDVSLIAQTLAAATDFDARTAVEYNLVDHVVDEYPHAHVYP